MKILFLRFSSFGDILAVMSVPAALRRQFPKVEIHWVTRADFADMAKTCNDIDKVWVIERNQGLKALWQMAQILRKEKFTHVYDAHNNMRSHLLSWLLVGPFGLGRWWSGQKFLRRSQYRFRRLMLFRFHVNLYPKPFVHQWALLEPLRSWGVSLVLPPAPLLEIPHVQHELAQGFLPPKWKNEGYVALAPSASYELKRWPVRHWQELVRLNPQLNFVVLGGPEDHFVQEIVNVAPERVLQLAGQLNYVQSSDLVATAKALVSNDTGLMHVAEQLGKACVALLGPAPFGYPGRATTSIQEIELACRPCSKHGQGPCVNPEHQKCMVDLSPMRVSQALQRVLRA